MAPVDEEIGGGSHITDDDIFARRIDDFGGVFGVFVDMEGGAAGGGGLRAEVEFDVGGVGGAEVGGGGGGHWCWRWGGIVVGGRGVLCGLCVCVCVCEVED